MGSSIYTDRNGSTYTSKWGPFTYMDFDVLRRYEEDLKKYYEERDQKHSNNKNSYSDSYDPRVVQRPKKKHSDRNSFTNVNSDSNNSEKKSSTNTYWNSFTDPINCENNPFTDVDSDYNESESNYSTYTDSYRHSFTNENSAKPNKNSGFFTYKECPLIWDEKSQTLRRRGETITIMDSYRRSFTNVNSDDNKGIHFTYWPK